MPNPIETFHNAVKSANFLSMSRSVRLLNANKPKMGGDWAQVTEIALQSGDDIAALEAARNLIAAMPGHAQSYIWLATVQSVMGDHDDAVNTLKDQLNSFPNDGVLRTRLGREAINAGRIELARSSYAKALELNGHDAVALEGLSELNTFNSGDPLLLHMEELRLSWPAGTDARSKGILSYSIAKAYNDLGDFDVAAHRVVEASAFYRDSAPFDIQVHEDSTRQMIATYDDRFISANDESGVIDARQVFITAPPCCGAEWLCDVLKADETATSLSRNNALFWMSASSLGDHNSDALLKELALGETNSVFNAVAHTYLEYVGERFGKDVRRIIDPSTLNEVSGGAVGLCLPAAKMVQIRRDPRDLAWSIYSRRFRRGRHWSYHPDDIARVLSCYERLIGRWFDLFGDRILQVKYDDLVYNPVEEVKAIAKFALVDVEAVASEAWLRADQLKSDPPGGWKRAGSRFAPMAEALKRVGLVET